MPFNSRYSVSFLGHSLNGCAKILLYMSEDYGKVPGGGAWGVRRKGENGETFTSLCEGPGAECVKWDGAPFLGMSWIKPSRALGALLLQASRMQL